MKWSRFSRRESSHKPSPPNRHFLILVMMDGRSRAKVTQLSTYFSRDLSLPQIVGRAVGRK